MGTGATALGVCWLCLGVGPVRARCSGADLNNGKEGVPSHGSSYCKGVWCVHHTPRPEGKQKPEQGERWLVGARNTKGRCQRGAGFGKE
jgi:hypothetical protein